LRKKKHAIFSFFSVIFGFFSHVGSIRVDILLSVLSLAFFFFFVVELEIPTLIGLLKLFSLEIYYLFGCGKFFFHTLFFFFYTNIYKYIYARNNKKETHMPDDSSIQSAQQRGCPGERIFFCLNLFLPTTFFFSFDALVKVESRNQLFPCRGTPIVFVPNFLSNSFFEIHFGHLRQPPPYFFPVCSRFFFSKAFFMCLYWLPSKQQQSCLMISLFLFIASSLES
jgi:hypothetical protein